MEQNEFLIRVTISADLDRDNLFPEIEDWACEQMVLDREIGVCYATYCKLVKQDVDGDGPNIDALSDIAAEVDYAFGHDPDYSYEKKIHLVSPPIAIWES